MQTFYTCKKYGNNIEKLIEAVYASASPTAMLTNTGSFSNCKSMARQILWRNDNGWMHISSIFGVVGWWPKCMLLLLLWTGVLTVDTDVISIEHMSSSVSYVFNSILFSSKFSESLRCHLTGWYRAAPTTCKIVFIVVVKTFDFLDSTLYNYPIEG